MPNKLMVINTLDVLMVVCTDGRHGAIWIVHGSGSGGTLLQSSQTYFVRSSITVGVCRRELFERRLLDLVKSRTVYRGIDSVRLLTASDLASNHSAPHATWDANHSAIKISAPSIRG
jgi:hypothetical protein